ncbi:MAG: hypothetical protein KAV87_10650 [Desulfobacteraceae bacterium]|nr:hypothetical protein [Desulfobacteraceae bacterium]
MTEKELPDLSGTKEMKAMDDAQTNLEASFKVLTDMQRIYVDGRLAGLTPYASCKAAGYADAQTVAYRLERTPRVRDALDAASKVARVSLDMSRDDVLEGLMESLQMCANATEMTNVWKEIGKIIGAYQPLKIEHTHNIGDMTNTQLQRMSNKELVGMADQPGAIIDVKDDIVDAEFEVLKDSVKPPEPIDYDNMEVVNDSTEKV